jgi:two-component system, OmpR family, sensor histidine kinase KdpD
MSFRVAVRAHHEGLAAVAHELRLPLSHIKGFVTSLRRADVEWDEEMRSEFLAEIDLETDRLAQLVESLLVASAPDGSIARVPNLVFTDPATVVDGALHRIRGLLAGRFLRRKMTSSLPAVRMDASQMERVLANLLQNAIKYSPPGSPIGVSARTTRRGELEFTIDDQGPGILAEDRERIFEPFFRKQTAKQSNVPGNGLGLAICQSIVLAHGGHMRVSVRRGGGARFSVFLPGPIRTEQFENSSKAKDGSNDPAKHSDRGRRGANAQASLQQPQSQRLRRTGGSGWHGSIETDRGTPVRPAAA